MLAASSPISAGCVEYAARRVQYVILASFTPQRTEILLEATSGQLRASAGDAWEVIQATAGLDPKVSQVVLLDEDTNDRIAEARTGLKAQASRAELRMTAGIAIATTIWLVIAIVAFKEDADVVLGAVPAVIAGLFAFTSLVLGYLSQKLVWT